MRPTRTLRRWRRRLTPASPPPGTRTSSRPLGPTMPSSFDASTSTWPDASRRSRKSAIFSTTTDRTNVASGWTESCGPARTTRRTETPTSITSPMSGEAGCWRRPTSRHSSGSRLSKRGCGSGSRATSATTGLCVSCSPSRSPAIRAGRKGLRASSTRPTNSSRRTWRAARRGYSWA